MQAIDHLEADSRSQPAGQQPERRRAGIVGAGSIGVAFAVVFARAGWRVRLFDPDEARRAAAPAEIALRLADLAHFALIDESAMQIAERVDVVDTLEAAAADADLVQECAPERAELKRGLFAQLDRAAPPHAILASASSFLSASEFVDAALPGHARCLVAHPGNPPYLVPVIEIVPAPFTSGDATVRAVALYGEAGLMPVQVKKEVAGFIFNRLQGAVLREAYCLVRDNVASVDDIDTVMREGLAPRWSVIGPFETVDLNTRGGIASHAQKMGPSYERMGAERGQHDPWTPELVARVAAARRATLPLDQWDARVTWRDRQLMHLARHRKLGAPADDD
ncbi:3-hydroxyacyl-CoA dehydrogenase [Burkholderia ubonensis]|uniref:3-hydroxyacyl-CoA dehydrogenase n=1 Tax=Burkholderia ubonensis TaxID=101571 RepID=UPI000BA60BA3|nr:3-hydroxyacyl-CoA dehydrogenase [Burkholderia ubonensis]PAK10629.1 3-hydroxyacyl-CoA dehydrogenase [Burkholderia ubonensis]RQP35722.1 3-hydroxyacyl-CoA dehydrogenase [Burkholderia ubonensis]RQP40628.1 3-hydroxyacyl-CoA dehydrogenase [Burkholderia ubonensis]RQP41132.1 3-hydroxyacyl-CoA dehydrogenase [Burkholderia ubonensis]RQP48994.1 3-hydroxyacyl-CoA dehydrogenase [Burkholderia ubonensis]